MLSVGQKLHDRGLAVGVGHRDADGRNLLAVVRKRRSSGHRGSGWSVRSDRKKPARHRGPGRSERLASKAVLATLRLLKKKCETIFKCMVIEVESFKAWRTSEYQEVRLQIGPLAKLIVTKLNKNIVSC